MTATKNSWQTTALNPAQSLRLRVLSCSMQETTKLLRAACWPAPGGGTRDRTFAIEPSSSPNTTLHFLLQHVGVSPSAKGVFFVGKHVPFSISSILLTLRGRTGACSLATLVVLYLRFSPTRRVRVLCGVKDRTPLKTLPQAAENYIQQPETRQTGEKCARDTETGEGAVSLAVAH